VISGMDLRVRSQRCTDPGNGETGGLDYIAEVAITGTAIARFGGPPATAAAGSLAIVALDPERRRAARARGATLTHPDAGPTRRPAK
jgi:hypothetical protein